MKRIVICITYLFAFISMLLFSAVDSVAQNNSNSEWRSFLDNLSGSWNLAAKMGSNNLHQLCDGDWVLQGNFIRMECNAVLPDSSGYQAIYLIGYHSEKEHYIFHLFDVYGGDYSETIGIGKLENNRIRFEFNYSQGLFQNTFIWNEEDQEWEMILKQQNEDGSWKLFSEKVLSKND